MHLLYMHAWVFVSPCCTLCHQLHFNKTYYIMFLMYCLVATRLWQLRSLFILYISISSPLKVNYIHHINMSTHISCQNWGITIFDLVIHCIVYFNITFDLSMHKKCQILSLLHNQHDLEDMQTFWCICNMWSTWFFR